MKKPVKKNQDSFQVKSAWRGHLRLLLKLRDRLLKQKHAQLDQVAEPLESHSLSLADSATDEWEHNLALAELSAEQDALYEIEEAIHRIEDGTYGVCQETGAPIPAERLRAIPWTRFCREAEERREKNGAVPGPHLGTAASANGRTSARIKSPLAPADQE